MDLSSRITKADQWGCRLYLLLVKGGVLVLSHKLEEKFKKEGSTCNSYEEVISDLKTRKIINESQYKKIFPNDGTTEFQNFDITLSVALYRAIFSPKFPGWHKDHVLDVNDFSTEADIVRIRDLRNEVIHKPKFTKEEFDNLWQRIVEALVRLGKSDIKEIETELEKFKFAPLDETNIKDKVKEWVEMDKAMESLIIKTILKHSQSVNALERSRAELSDVLGEEYFVKTGMFNTAEEMLERDGVVVIKGAQGEGKTTIAKKLVKNKDKCLKINSLTDWDMYSRENVETVLIDDIFGCTMFDKRESLKLTKIFPMIMDSVSQKKLKLIITSRSYILDDALKRLYISHHIRESNILEISSRKLNDKEKKEILENHMNMNNKEIDERFIEDCVRQSNQPSSFVIGFPECARLFCAQDSLFQKKESFFETPMTHIKKCLVNVFEKTDTFLAFFVVWAQRSQKLCLIDLEQRPVKTRDVIKHPIEQLGFNPNDTLRRIHEILSSSKDFINYDTKTETCQFQHRVLGDAVGLVAFEKNKSAVLRYCDAPFIERYVCIEGQNVPEKWHDRITVFPRRFEQLSLKIGNLICPRPETQKDEQYLNCTLLLHPAFKVKAFCDNFVEIMNERDMLYELLTKSVGTVGTSLLTVQSTIDSETFKTEIGILAYALTNSVNEFAFTCFSVMKSDDRYKKRLETDLKMSMLLAVSESNEDKIKCLAKIMEAQTIDSDIIFTAIKRADVNNLDLLLDISKSPIISHYTRDGKSPLTFFVQEKEGRTAIECILQSKHCRTSDIDYQNEKDGKTALHIACATGNAEIIQLILGKKPSLQIKDRNQECPIHTAALMGKTDIVELLLDCDIKQADYPFDMKNKKGMLLYHIAIQKDDYGLLNLLLSRKLTVTGVNGKKQTPLAFALQEQKFALIKELTDITIQQNAHTMLDNDGRRALQIAIDKMLSLPNGDTLNDLNYTVERLFQNDGSNENAPLQVIQNKRLHHQEQLERLDNVIKKLKKE